MSITAEERVKSNRSRNCSIVKKNRGKQEESINDIVINKKGVNHVVSNASGDIKIKPQYITEVLHRNP